MVTGEQFEVPHRVAKLKLKPTTLVVSRTANVRNSSGVALLRGRQSDGHGYRERACRLHRIAGNSRSSSRPTALSATKPMRHQFRPFRLAIAASLSDPLLHMWRRAKPRYVALETRTVLVAGCEPGLAAGLPLHAGMRYCLMPRIAQRRVRNAPRGVLFVTASIGYQRLSVPLKLQLRIWRFRKSETNK